MQTANTDILIIGGGISGLWLLNTLRQKNISAILLEKHKLGGEQTIASQGIIHRGLKYALQGKVTASSKAIADMPSIWKQNFTDELKDVKILAEHQHLWSSNNLAAKITSFFASRTLRSKITPITNREHPIFNQDFNGNLYQLEEQVIDVTSLINVLYDLNKKYIYKIEDLNIKYSNDIEHVIINNSIKITANNYIFTAGKANAELTKDIINAPRMQLRPLHQVLVKLDKPLILYGHCITASSSFNATPTLTITSHHCQDGKIAWALGGKISEDGVGKDAIEQISCAKQVIKKCLPWLELQNSQWQTFHIDRAEAGQHNNTRPADAFVSKIGNAIIAWPTKLTLAPNLTQQVLNIIKPQDLNYDITTLEHLPKPAVALTLWDKLFC